ncbi:glycosyltransferase family 9 protein, partial [bacterium]|nr:glycosyltransferase family 9 protein [bacterium]
MTARAINNIMVVKLRTLGDILAVFPLLRALKQLYPQARLTVVADEIYHELFETNPRVDEFWGHPGSKLQKNGVRSAFKQQWDTIRNFRKRKIDLFIDLYGSLRTALWGAGAGIPIRMGFNLRGRKYFYTHKIKAACRYVVDLNLQFARVLGWQGGNNALEFFVTERDRDQAWQYLRERRWDPRRPSLVVSPGGGWPLKQWGAERFGQVARKLVRSTGCQVLITGTPQEQPLITACRDTLKGVLHIPVVGLPLRQLAAVIGQSRLYLGNDSGPKYFAEAFK